MQNKYQIDTFKYDLQGYRYYCEVWDTETGEVVFRTEPELLLKVRKEAIDWIRNITIVQ